LWQREGAGFTVSGVEEWIRAECSTDGGVAQSDAKPPRGPGWRGREGRGTKPREK